LNDYYKVSAFPTNQVAAQLLTRMGSSAGHLQGYSTMHSVPLDSLRADLVPGLATADSYSPVTGPYAYYSAYYIRGNNKNSKGTSKRYKGGRSRARSIPLFGSKSIVRIQEQAARAQILRFGN